MCVSAKNDGQTTTRPHLLSRKWVWSENLQISWLLRKRRDYGAIMASIGEDWYLISENGGGGESLVFAVEGEKEVKHR